MSVIQVFVNSTQAPQVIVVPGSSDPEITVEPVEIQVQIVGASLPGIPEGGTAGQVLTKVDGEDYNATWEEPTGGVGGDGINWLGAYAGATNYVPNDAVSYNGSSYICIANSTANLPTDTDFWEPMALKGDTGAAGAPGADGDDGAPGADGSDGAPGLDGDPINWRGAYNGATPYSALDAVSYLGSSYVALGNTTGNLPTNPTFWDLMAQKGDTGAAGADGAPGADGADGAPGADGDAADMAVETHASTAKPTPADADEFGYANSVGGFVNWVRITAGEIKTWLATVFLPLAGGTMTGTINEAQGANIATGSTTDIGGATDGNLIYLTGNASIDDLGEAPAGAMRHTVTTGTPTFEHNAVSLICLTGANVVAQAGDRQLWRSLGPGDWIMMDYVRANGSALAGSVTLTKSSTPTSGFTDNKLLKSTSNVLEQASLFEDDGTTAKMASALSDAASLRHYAFMSRNSSSGLSVDGGGWNAIDSFSRFFFGCIAADSSNQWTYNRYGQRNAIATLNASTLTLNRNNFHIAVAYTATGAVTITLPSAADCWDAVKGVGQKFIVSDKGLNASAFNITVQRNATPGTDAILTDVSGSSAVLALDGGKIEIVCISATEFKVNIIP